MIESRALSLAAGCNIHLKLDLLQPSGSFKSRGIGNLISLASSRHTPHSPETLHFYCSSGGNAGLAAARAALTLGHRITICVPTTCTGFMIAKLEALGAKVYQHGGNWGECDEYLRTVVMKGKAGGEGVIEGEVQVYVPPFDHPDIWAGAQSLVPEMEKQMVSYGGYDGVVCSVGGGGLFIGLSEGFQEAGLSGKRAILAVETEGGHSLNHSLREGELSTLKSITTMATSLGCPRVAKRAFECALRGNVASAVLSDAQGAMGCVHLADMERLQVEVACGVSIASCFDGTLRNALGAGLTDDEWAQKRIVIIVCGGSIISSKLLEEYREKYEDVVKMEIKAQKNRVVKKMLRAEMKGNAEEGMSIENMGDRPIIVRA